MRDQFYSDKHDLVKWAILYQLANDFGASRIIQIAFYQKSIFPKIIIAGEEFDILPEVISHFRDLRKICNINSNIRVNVFDVIFSNPRGKYLDAVKSFLSSFPKERCIVFLDPDTGLEPERQRPKLEHVLEKEAAEIWGKLKSGDIYAFYQHRNRKGNWINYMKSRIEEALHLTEDNLLEIANVKKIKPEKTPDVVFFYKEKPPGGVKEEKIKNVCPECGYQFRDQGFWGHQPPPKKAEPLRKPKVNKMECPCGCGKIPEGGIFMQGHDGRICGWMRKMEEGRAKPEDFVGEVRQIYREWVKQGKPGGDFHCKIKKIVEKIRGS